jgi:hypothetical protein
LAQPEGCCFGLCIDSTFSHLRSRGFGWNPAEIPPETKELNPVAGLVLAKSHLQDRARPVESRGAAAAKSFIPLAQSYSESP